MREGKGVSLTGRKGSLNERVLCSPRAVLMQSMVTCSKPLGYRTRPVSSQLWCQHIPCGCSARQRPALLKLYINFLMEFYQPVS